MSLYRRIGEYRGAAHSIWNLKCSVSTKIPIFFHNGSNYDYHCIIKELAEKFKDYHFIIKELAEKFKKQFTCLGENTEKYSNTEI